MTTFMLPAADFAAIQGAELTNLVAFLGQTRQHTSSDHLGCFLAWCADNRGGAAVGEEGTP